MFYQIKKEDMAKMPPLFLQGPYNQSFPQVDLSFKKLNKEEHKEYKEVNE